MVRGDSSWDFDYTARREVTRRWLEEEEWLLRKSVLELLDVIRIVTAYCNYLFDLRSNNLSGNVG
jgi:hypothetical protein